MQARAHMLIPKCCWSIYSSCCNCNKLDRMSHTAGITLYYNCLYENLYTILYITHRITYKESSQIAKNSIIYHGVCQIWALHRSALCMLKTGIQMVPIAVPIHSIYNSV